MTREVPSNLRAWFLIHFFVDIIFAIPLLISPVWFLSLLGWEIIDPFASRLVGAALFGIGGISLLSRNKGLESYQSLLTLKIIWSVSAIIGILLSIIENVHKIRLIILIMFSIFSAVWIYYKFKLS